MESNDKLEARRRKVLENAEARLRFIKEGIPWRNTEDQVKNDESNIPASEETSSNEQISEDNQEAQIRSDLNQQSSSSLENRLSETDLKVSDDKTEINNEDSSNNQCDQVNASGIPNPSRNKLEIPITSQGNINRDTHLDEKLKFFNETLSKWNNPESQSDGNDTIKVLKSLLMESNFERRENKQKANDYNKRILISSVVMLCLGIFVRASYLLGFSWMFNEMMLVPFFTIAIPHLIQIFKEPPSPSGTLSQILLMSGIRHQVINRVFTVAAIGRTFLQLFSVYLVSFLFTHQLVETLSALTD